MQKRIREKNLELDWKKDDGEYACRIWEWWRPRMKYLPCFALALILVVLTQLSSCSVDRVFSGLKIIVDFCHLEMCLFIQYNGDLNKI